eukprot:7908112-Alexandrium_andersonii.AAC.1
MSASLVGSEMCIRDSVRHRSTRTPPRAVPPGEGRREAAKSALAALKAPCLLYTSDAADDM